jgi:hypothetical protein
LHNILAHLGDAWAELDVSVGVNDHPGAQGASGNEDTAKEHWDVVQAKCLEINYASGVLPI